MLHLAQISDLHLSQSEDAILGGISPDRHLKNVLEAILTNHTSLDGLLISGDLADDGHPWAYRRLDEALANFSLPIFVLPGNHDDFASMRSILTQEKYHFGPLASLDHWYLVLLDSTLDDESHGHLSSTKIERLQKALQQSHPHPTLVALHHSPITIGTPWMDHIGLRQPEPFQNLLRHHPHVQAVLFGHAHQAVEISKGNLVFLGAPATSFQFIPGTECPILATTPPGYRFMSLSEHGINQSEVIRISS